MDPVLQPLLQYGVLGVVAVTLVLFARDAIKREREEKAAAVAEVARLNALMQEKMIPALVSATQVLLSAQSVLQNVQYQRDLEAAVRKQTPGGGDKK